MCILFRLLIFHFISQLKLDQEIRRLHLIIVFQSTVSTKERIDMTLIISLLSQF